MVSALLMTTAAFAQTGGAGTYTIQARIAAQSAG